MFIDTYFFDMIAISNLAFLSLNYGLISMHTFLKLSRKSHMCLYNSAGR